jgi:hypothetical protein
MRPPARCLARLKPTRRATWSGLALALILLSGLFNQPAQFRLLVRPVLPLLRLWNQPDAQYRALLGDVPYDLLREADAALPRSASVLLVTPGRDVRRLEYTFFHRALYFLAPRSVWWLAPAPSDGSWESRWRISAPLTAASVQVVAQAHEVTHILVFQPPGAVALDLPWGRKLAAWEQGYLLAVDPAAPHRPDGTTPVSPTVMHPASLLALPLALAVIWLLGFGVLQGAAWLGYRAAGLERLALAWMLGSGAISLAMWQLDRLGLTLPNQIRLLTLCALVILAGWGWARQRRGPPGVEHPHAQEPTPRPPRRLRWTYVAAALLAALLVIQIAAVALVACGAPLRIWDSWVTWGMKSRIIFLDGGVSPAVYADPSRAVTLLDYPLLAPLNQAWLYGWLGAADDRLVGVLSVLHYLALLGLCAAALQRRGASRLVILATVTAIAMLPNLATWTGAVLSDVPLALFATAAGLYLAAWLQGEAAGALLIAALAAGLLPWAKNEGALLWLALVAALLVVGVGRRLARSERRPPRPIGLAVAVLLLLALAINASWQLVLRGHPAPNNAFVPVTWAAWQANAHRLPTILRLAATALAGARVSYAWPLAALLLLRRAVWPRRQTPGAARRLAWPNLWLLMPAIYIALVSLGFVFSDYQPYWQHVTNSIDRLLTHVTPLVILWVALPWATRPTLVPAPECPERAAA